MIDLKLKDGSEAHLEIRKSGKILNSKNYKFAFNSRTGLFVRCGETPEQDADLTLGLPEIADIEISTICKGIGTPCKFCYKNNTSKGEYMSLDTFKELFKKLPPTITQIAFGIGDIDANPDMFKIFEYCRENNIIPNVTINGFNIQKDYFNNFAKLCGAVAVSYYDKDICFNTIKELAQRGMSQCNIHFMLAEETYLQALQLLEDIKTDKRVKKLNAIVFLSLKKKGRATKNYTSLSKEKFKELSMKALNENINIGFDSCGCWKFLEAIKDTEYYEKVEKFIEPCEAAIYSSYFNVKGEYFPCSFIEGTQGWESGLSILESDKFWEDIWWSEKVEEFRSKVIKCRENCKNCPVYEI